MISGYGVDFEDRCGRIAEPYMADKDLDKSKHVVGLIIAGRPLEERHRDHALGGKWVGSRDCHIEPDWVLIYRVDGESLYLECTGTHGELFRT